MLLFLGYLRYSQISANFLCQHTVDFGMTRDRGRQLCFRIKKHAVLSALTNENSALFQKIADKILTLHREKLLE